MTSYIKNTCFAALKPFGRTSLLSAVALCLYAAVPVTAMADDQATGTVASQTDFLPLSGPSLLLLRKADKALSRGEPQVAIDALNEAIRQRPDSGALRTALVNALQSAGRDEEAEQTARAAAADTRIYADARRRLSAKATAIGQERAAEAKVADDAELRPALDAETRRQPSERADAIRQDSTGESAAEDVDEDMAAKPSASPTAPSDAAPLKTSDPAYQAADAAYRAYDRGDYRKAVAEAEKAVRLAPSDSDYSQLLENARAALAQQASRQEGADENGAGDADEGTAAKPTESPAYQAADAAYSAYARGDYRKAVAEAKKAVRLAPSNSDYQQLFDNASAALAQTTIRPAVAAPSTRAADQAYAALRRNDLNAALVYAKRAAQSAPGDRTNQVLLIDVLNRSGKQEEALAVADAAIARLGADRSLLSQRGVLKQTLGDQIGAKVDFEQALMMPGPTAGEKQLRLNLAAAALATDEAELARQALAPLGDSDDIDVWLARGKALKDTADFSAAEEALQRAEALAESDRQRADIAVVRLDLVLAEYGKRPARSALRTAEAEGVLSPLSSTETAYLADRVGDRSLAYNAFSEADATNQLNGAQYIDAAYAARRNYQNDAAVAWLKRAIDEADAGTLSLSPAELFALRRSVSDISRRWGANIGLFYGSSGISDGFVTPPASAGRTAQLGAEFYWRPPVIGYRDGRTLDLFIRQFTTLSDSLDGAVGTSTTQGAIGLRLKPFTNANFTLEAARYFKIGRYSRDDYLLRGAISGGLNTDLMVASRQWWTAQYFAEAGRYLQSNENFASAYANFGRSFSFGADGRFIITPFVGIAADYGSIYATAFALGAGPGVNLRYWFRETKYQAPMSYVDLNIQYRAKLDGDDRAEGWFGSLNLIL